MSATYVVQLTGSGRSAVATVMVDGPRAAGYVQTFFQGGGSRDEYEIDKTYFGTWRCDDYEEELVICRTGPEQIEVHCHGGRLAASHIVGSLEQAGATRLDHEGWLELSESDTTVRHAKRMLSSARTERIACILLDQIRGAFDRGVREIVAAISSDLNSARETLERLIALGDVGARLSAPITVLLAGAPNAGKSSLVNAIVGYRRAIVFDQPGTTRDLVSVETVLDGWPVSLTDTAGIRDSSDVIEQEGIRRAQRQLAEADVVLQVRDLTTGAAAPVLDDSEFVIANPSAVVIRVGTKADLAEDEVEQLAGELDVVTSAVSGQGIQTLLDQIVVAKIPSPPVPGEAVPLSEQVVVQLMKARQHLDLAELTEATRTLSALLS